MEPNGDHTEERKSIENNNQKINNSTKNDRAVALMIQSNNKDEKKGVSAIAAVEICNYFITGRQFHLFFILSSSPYYQNDSALLTKLIAFINGDDVYTYKSELVRLVLNRKLKACKLPLFKLNQFKTIDHLLEKGSIGKLDNYLSEDNVYVEKCVPFDGELVKSAFMVAKCYCYHKDESRFSKDNQNDGSGVDSNPDNNQNVKNSLLDFINAFDNMKLGNLND